MGKLEKKKATKKLLSAPPLNRVSSSNKNQPNPSDNNIDSKIEAVAAVLAPTEYNNIKAFLHPRKRQPGKWERKSESEIESIQKELKKTIFNPWMPAVMFVFSFCTYCLCHANLTVAFLISMVVLAATFLIQLKNGRSLAMSPSFKICKKCLKEDRIGLKICPCGGTLEPPEYYHFIEHV